MLGPESTRAISKIRLALPCLGFLVSSAFFAPHLLAQSSNDSSGALASLSLDELLEVEVTTSGKIPETIRDTPASVYLFTRSDIEKRGYSNLTQILSDAPGLYNIDNYEGVSGNFGVRGFWNGRSQNGSVAILLNGIPQTRMDTYSHPMEMLGLPVEAIDRIEIVSGPNSVIYGNGASFGAINIITDDSRMQNYASVSYGSRGAVRSAVSYSAQNPDFRFTINAGISRSDGPGPHLADLISDAGQLELPFLGIDETNDSLDGKLESETRFLQISGSWKDLYYDYSYNQADVEFFLSLPPVGDGSVKDVSNSRLTVGWKSEAHSNLTIDTRATLHRYALEQDFDALSENFIGENTLEYDGIEVESLLTYRHSPQTSLIAGVNWQRMQDLREFTLVPALGLNNEVVQLDKRDTQAFFAQANVELDPKWRLVTGFRIEEQKAYDRFGYTNIEVDDEPTFGTAQPSVENFTPRVSLAYRKSESEVFKFMAGDAIKLSTVFADALKPERTRTIEANYIRSSASAFASLSIFHNTSKNLITEELIDLPGGGVDAVERQRGVIKTNGLEGLWRRKLSDDLTVELSATWQDSEDESNALIEVAYSPELVAQLKLAYAKDDFSASLTGRYVGEMESFYDVSNANIEGGLGDRIGLAASDYASFDFNARRDNVWNGLYLNFRVSNIFDTEVRYPNNPLNSTRLDKGHIGFGRRVLLTTGIEF